MYPFNYPIHQWILTITQATPRNSGLLYRQFSIRTKELSALAGKRMEAKRGLTWLASLLNWLLTTYFRKQTNAHYNLGIWDITKNMCKCRWMPKMPQIVKVWFRSPVPRQEYLTYRETECTTLWRHVSHQSSNKSGSQFVNPLTATNLHNLRSFFEFTHCFEWDNTHRFRLLQRIASNLLHERTQQPTRDGPMDFKQYSSANIAGFVRVTQLRRT